MSLLLRLAEFLVIETDRLVLRPLTLQDAEDMYAYASRPENLEYIFPPHQSLEETRSSIASRFMVAPLGKWGIVLKADEKMLGTIDFVMIDGKNKVGVIGYVLNMDYWGRGLMTEAVQVLTQNALEKIGFLQLVIEVDVENLGSVKVALKSGYELQDIYKRINKYTGKVRQFARYTITNACG